MECYSDLASCRDMSDRSIPRRSRRLDTNRCSCSYESYGEHTFGLRTAGGEVVGTVAAPVGPSPVRPRRPHPTHRRPAPRTFRPGGPEERRLADGRSHRGRPVHPRCDDPRAAARAAAVRRRHLLLALLAVALLLALAAPWSGKADGSLATPGPAQATLAAHAVYIVQPGDTLWSIAQRLDPEGDPRPTMAALSEQAGGDTLRPGERLILP
jgi:hypothetical protein